MLPFVQEPAHTVDDFRRWVFSHADDHQEIITAIRNVSGILLNMYDIYDYTEQNSPQWEEWHQQMHNDMAAILGTNVSNLSEFSFRELASGWFFENFQDHQAAHTILRI